MKKAVFITLSVIVAVFIIFWIIIPEISNVSQAAITKGPYLINPGQTSMTIMWESDSEEKAILRYGPNADLGNTLNLNPYAERDSLFLYRADLEQLRPGLKYSYQIKMSTDQSVISHFKTSPEVNSPIEFVAIGDSRTGHDIHRSISDMILELNPDLVIRMGNEYILD